MVWVVIIPLHVQAVEEDFIEGNLIIALAWKHDFHVPHRFGRGSEKAVAATDNEPGSEVDVFGEFHLVRVVHVKPLFQEAMERHVPIEDIVYVGDEEVCAIFQHIHGKMNSWWHYLLPVRRRVRNVFLAFYSDEEEKRDNAVWLTLSP